MNVDRQKRIASRALSLGSGSLFLAWASTAARAAEPLGTIATNIHGNLDETMKLATVVVFITGFILVGIGVFLIWRMGHHQGMHAPATLFTCLAAIIAGVLMVYHSTVVGVGGATIFGESSGDVTIEGTVEVR